MSEYDTDFYRWTQGQAAALLQGRFADLDIKNLAEEIESLGRRERKELRSYLEGLLVHLLKWQYQPGRRSRSWELSIGGNRDTVPFSLEDNPSLQAQMPVLLAEAYRRARTRAARQTMMDLRLLPLDCPWTLEQVLDENFYPGESDV